MAIIVEDGEGRTLYDDLLAMVDLGAIPLGVTETNVSGVRETSGKLIWLGLSVSRGLSRPKGRTGTSVRRRRRTRRCAPARR